MTYITVKEASEKWNISTRRVCVLCSKGQIPGAVKKSKVWMIPANASKPEDGRKTEQVYELDPVVLILNPDYFERRPELTPNREEKKLCEIQQIALSGNHSKAYEEICYFISTLEKDRYLFTAYMIKTLIAGVLGNKEGYTNSFQTLNELVVQSEDYISERIIYRIYMEFEGEDIVLNLSNNKKYLEIMPLVSLLNAKIGINKMIRSENHYSKYDYEIICMELEDKDCPLILAYYHIYLAVYYNAMSLSNIYDYHIRKAAQILLPRKWYSPLAEYSATIDLGFIKDIDKKAYKTIMNLSEKIIFNYVKVGIFSAKEKPLMETYLSVQIAFKIVQGKNNKEIAEELGISQYKVRKHIDDICNLAGITSKKEIKQAVLNNFYI